MSRSWCFGLVILAFSVALFGAPARADPRSTVHGVADAIRANFFDAAAGDRIADALEDEAKAGAYDTFVDPGELASRLSDRLKPEDPHFAVVFENAAEEAGATVDSPPRLAGIEAAIVSNFGFSEVLILPGNIGYVRMSSFSPIDFTQPDDSIRAAADAVLTLVSFTDAVIFDLRQNGGGSSSMVGYLVSAFTPPGADIYSTFLARDGVREERVDVSYPSPRLDVPVYVLISGRTGSAAEGFAYTLQAARRAQIVGEASAGASNPGELVEVGGGFSVFVSNATPVNPITGGNWGGVGVQPDLPSAWDQALEVAQRDALTLLARRETSPARAQNAAWALAALEAPADFPPQADHVGRYGGVEIVVSPHGLSLLQGNRPPRSLIPHSVDLFRVEGDPSTRVRFVRDGTGRVSALEILSTVAPPVRRRRDD